MKAVIELEGDKRLEELFAPEDKNMSRANYNVSVTQDKTIIAVDAKDAVALRTALSSITKILSLWEQSKGL